MFILRRSALLFFGSYLFISLVSAGGRIGIDLALENQPYLWAEDVFLNKERNSRHYFDIFPSHTARHISARSGYSKLEVLRASYLHYQYTFDNGWYVGLEPAYGVTFNSLGSQERPEDLPEHMEHVSQAVRIAVDFGLRAGKYFGGKNALGKFEVATGHGLNVRLCGQYLLTDMGKWALHMNHAVSLASLPAQTIMMSKELNLNKRTKPPRQQAEFFNGLRLECGGFSIGSGYRVGYQSSQFQVLEPIKTLEEQEKGVVLPNDAHPEVKTGYAPPAEKPILITRSPGSQSAVKHEWKKVVRERMLHNVFSDITYSWKHARLTFHHNFDIPKRGHNFGVRWSYHW